ncbi:MAG: solute:sodium symporter family transporter [Phycisphaera sp.]|nr:MAG: solute:sodium symporter family transporter [Phycisphaera sp.]
MSVALISFVGTTALVAALTLLAVRRMKRSENAIDDFFAGGRSLAWPIVGGSLLLTNLSTEQLVGLNGAVFKDGNLVGIAWEALAAFAMIATALLFLPKYMASGFTTTTAYLEQRYDRATRVLVSGLFLFGYVTVLLPVVLYTGGLALQGMFRIDLPLWLIIAGIGVLGSLYAIFGGLRAVAVSDTLNGVGLLICGLAVPILALIVLGDGSLTGGISRLAQDRPESLTPIATKDKSGEMVSVPWPTLLTGMMFIQVFYWSTNQVIVQRAMGARSLAGGQKGVLFAASMKLLGPVMLCLPGIIALHMTDRLSIEDTDTVYPAIAREVMPTWSLGFFGAVIVGAILSSFNSALNSAATLFCLDFYKPFVLKRGNAAGDRRVVVVGQIFATILAILAMIVAPLLAQMESIFEYLQKVNGLYSVPVISIFLVGILTKRAPAIGAKAAMVVGILTYAVFTFAETIVPGFVFTDHIAWYHWLHGYAASVLCALGTLAFFTLIAPRLADQIEAERLSKQAPVDMTPWKLRRVVSSLIVLATIAIYIGLFAISR